MGCSPLDPPYIAPELFVFFAQQDVPVVLETANHDVVTLVDTVAPKS
jgi:hypothetical protein